MKTTIDLSEKVYFKILEINHNVEPFILTIGSVLFKFVYLHNKNYYIDTFKSLEELKNYYLFSEENLCITYKFLKENNFIEYDNITLKYKINKKLL